MEKILARARRLNDRLMARKGAKEKLLEQVRELNQQREEATAKQRVAKQSILLFEFASQTAREAIRQRIDTIVSFALQSVFGEDYEFRTTIEIKRNAPWADFHVVSAEYTEPANPLLSRGGGVVDIISMALRIVFLELYTPEINGPLLLDEPTKQLSKEYSGRAAELLSAISDRTGRQIILVTHDSVLAKEAERKFEL